MYDAIDTVLGVALDAMDSLAWECRVSPEVLRRVLWEYLGTYMGRGFSATFYIVYFVVVYFERKCDCVWVIIWYEYHDDELHGSQGDLLFDRKGVPRAGYRSGLQSRLLRHITICYLASVGLLRPRSAAQRTNRQDTDYLPKFLQMLSYSL